MQAIERVVATWKRTVAPWCALSRALINATALSIFLPHWTWEPAKRERKRRTPRKRADFQAFLDRVLTDLPPDNEIHVILDNYYTHKRNTGWLEKYEGRVRIHFTPTSASWLNQIEIVFSLLQRKTLNGAGVKRKNELREAIEAFIERYNGKANPFRLADA